MRSGISLCVFTKPTENMNFPVRVYPTDKETLYFPVCSKFSMRVFTQPTGKSEFPYVFDYFPVSLSTTDKETGISLWVAEKTLREIRHTQGKNSFQ